MRTGLIQGRRVAWDVGGDPSGRPTLIIHGAWGGPASTLWQGPRIRWSAPTDGLRLVWYDRRCAGRSQYDTHPFTLRDLAVDAIHLLDHLDIDEAAIIATSAGGPIGLRLALDYPVRVAALVLLNTGASLMSLEPRRIDRADPFVADRLSTVASRLALLDLLDASGIEAAVAASEAEWRTPPVPPQDDLTLEPYRERRRRALLRMSRPNLIRLAHGALLNMRAQRGVDLSEELERLQVPTLVLHGDADTTVPLAFGEALARAIPGAQLRVLPNVGHGLIANPEAQRFASDWLRQTL